MGDGGFERKEGWRARAHALDPLSMYTYSPIVVSLRSCVPIVVVVVVWPNLAWRHMQIWRSRADIEPPPPPPSPPFPPSRISFNVRFRCTLS